LKATNDLRYQHIADVVIVDDKLAGLLQKDLTALTEAELPIVEKCWSKCVGPDAATLCPAGDANCDATTAKVYKDATHTLCPVSELALTVYKEKDTKKLNDFRTTGRATD
jgi:hypothetical protein